MSDKPPCWVHWNESGRPQKLQREIRDIKGTGMPRLLHIQSSPNLGGSLTRTLSQSFVETWVASHHDTQVELLDLATDPVPHFGPDIMAARGPQEDWTPATQAAVALSDRLCTQLEAADVLVIGSPMINLSICTQLKSWIDHVTVAGRTFEYAGPGIVRGLLFGKKAFVIEARGGDYADPPASAFDYQEPLTRALLGLLGIYDVTFIRAEGARQRPEEAGAIQRNAEKLVARLAA